VPALSGAVIRALAAAFDEVQRIDIGISPAGGTVMGPNVVRAILSYAGCEVAILQDGQWRLHHCWTDLTPHRLRVAGVKDLNRRRFSLCDVPDLTIWPALYPGLRTVHFGAALEPAVNHFGMVALAWLVRLGVIRQADILAPMLDRVARWLPSGVRRGGMYVRLSGRGKGEDDHVAEWNLIADGDHGPYIPTMASTAIDARVLRGEAPPPGARTGAEELQLDDFDALLAKFDIKTELREGATVR
jgi:hypothetical protein